MSTTGCPIYDADNHLYEHPGPDTWTARNLDLPGAFERARRSPCSTPSSGARGNSSER